MHESDARLARDGWVDLKNSFRKIAGSICAPRGFKCASVFCDIKKLGTGKGSEKGRKDDLALIVSDVPAAVAGTFTTNQVCAAPVRISRQHSSAKFARAIVVNSGNANAATGEQGMKDARRMTQLVAKALSLNARDVLVCSTGRIGVPMPMENVERGIRACAQRLAGSKSSARQVAEAIMTTDTRRKEIAVELNIGRSAVRIGGICKGAGMIQPGMATMLGFITTDAAIEPGILKRALKIAVEQSFNRITVDGDMSTNDSVIALANGLARNPKSETRNSKFQSALNFVCLQLAKMIVRDGEGTSRLIALRVRGARNDREAEASARSIANSSLVRASWCGGDPNWGRILCALGYSKARIDENVIDVGYAPTSSRKILFAFRRGRPTNVALKELARITSEPEFDLHVDLHLGRGAFMIYAADLTEDYVAFNKGDVTDPATLGG
ncbi:MAG TPA: bifunctional glutamate N-acetyltransferase/amino-acid acetyltransferase ArgJ [Chthoniobacterales bacterium]|jgi:glutamate N-acetyltransferase/amino-acid N-acetyltransferase|nr:bifunctional glutamate N-acetyltransferase/amino-acid acetyltransferase ArgJ [Chthoniobacterales bacterium]